ncbi:Protein transport protein sec39 [Zalerion maritima]|uniref:Protein transport protein sec39 n=1 Tax=Zalerion maritima TaxID=339359 RepID=A0AAD5RSH7_9PEZI|nr:Protein transport protein sec39 [Zalerion maritima]
MALVLSPPKTVLLAVHVATAADVDSLIWLAAHHSSILRPELLLRILLTYLPETLRSSAYVPFLHQVNAGEYEPPSDVIIDHTAVDSLTDDQAARKVKKLGLVTLSWPEAPEDVAEDPLSLFLIRRAYKVDEGARLLSQLPELVIPFLDHSPSIRTWTISILLPFVRRSIEFYNESLPITLEEFSRLEDDDAVDLLLAQSASTPEAYENIGRDLKGIVGPWLYNEKRWPARGRDGKKPSEDSPLEHHNLCPGFERVLEWLTAQALSSWKVAVGGIEQWDGPGDVDLGGYGNMWLDDAEQEYLEHRYARAALASAYLIPEPSADALKGAYSILAKITDMMDYDPITNLQMAASMLAPCPELCQSEILSPKNTTYMRNDLLGESNVLTTPSKLTLDMLHATILSAFILSRAGVPCSIRMAGELALLDNEHEQKEVFLKFMRAVSNRGPKTDDSYWAKARNEILWLRDWGAEEALGDQASTAKGGVFRLLKKESIEIEFLKALLSNSPEYSLARSLYEDGLDLPLPVNIVQDIVIASAMNAYDNASNPNRTRGGVKKCDDILYAFPKSIDASLPETKRIDALLRATHELSEYRLVLKQGEPFTPVVLRVHSDPISIVGKVLEQNPTSYTNIQDMLEIGFNMVKASLTVRDKHGHPALSPEDEPVQLSIAEKRITALCIDAALAEHDFETAYSYVVSRLSQIAEAVHSPSKPGSGPKKMVDEWSWKAALNAGKHKRTSKSTRPTHLGTASGNLEIRHLEQRIECLSTALRIAPPSTLQEILNTFRRCEEELETAIKAEEAEEDAWDTAGDLKSPRKAIPGEFVPGPKVQRGPVSAARAAEDAPLSLFDLARAVAPSAQKNLGGLASFQRFGQARGGGKVGTESDASSGGIGGALGGGFGGFLGGGLGGGSSDAGSAQGEEGDDGRPKARKRDQLRDAAMGTLVSGVGWLVGAPPLDRSHERE